MFRALWVSSSPEPFRKSRNEGFFRKIILEFLETFGEVSQPLSMGKIWEESGNGGEDVIEWGRGEEKCFCKDKFLYRLFYMVGIFYIICHILIYSHYLIWIK